MSTTNDQFTSVNWALPGSVGTHYNFGERPPAGGEVTPGQTATIGFWHNKHGQALAGAATALNRITARGLRQAVQ